MSGRCFVLACLLLPTVCFAQSAPETVLGKDAATWVKEAIDYWRDDSSYLVARMTIHRPSWQRTSALKSWTKGTDSTLVRFVSPAKDAGNATLTLDDDVWTFTPKTNRVIKIPPSMKSQSWMGSDFSYQDLSRDDEIVDQYTHKIIGEEQSEGKKVAVIESVPLESAPVVWGKEILRIREDMIILDHKFLDQDFKLVKTMYTRDIKKLGGKIYPVVMRIEKAENPDEWTEIVHEQAEFGLDISKNFFTLSNLRNPRR